MPELYIRFSLTDNGGRPVSGEWWKSPAIEIIRGVDASTARAEDPDQAIRVWVGNGGSNTRTDVMVQVFATDFGTTNPWLQSLGGTAGQSAGPLTVVGGARVQDGTETAFEIGWSPATSELDGETLKHVCLFANVHRPGDGAPQSDPPVFDVPGNHHHAQKNIKIAAALSGGGMRFGFHAANLEAAGEAFTLEVVPVKRARLAPFELRHLRSAGWIDAAHDRLRRRLGPLPAAADVQLRAGRRKGREIKVELEPGEQIPIAVDAGKAPKGPGLQRFSLLQRRARTGEIVGGAWLMAAVLPEELIPPRLRRDPDLGKG